MCICGGGGFIHEHRKDPVLLCSLSVSLSLLHGLKSGIRKNTENWKSETWKNEQKPQFVSLWKIIRALQSMQSGRIVHLRESTRLFLIYIQSKSKHDSEVLVFYCFWFNHESGVNPDSGLTQNWNNPDSSFYTWCRARKGKKKNLIINADIFSNFYRFKNHGFFTIWRTWDTRPEPAELFFVFFSCNRGPIHYDIIRNKAGTGDIQQRRVSSVLNWYYSVSMKMILNRQN